MKFKSTRGQALPLLVSEAFTQGLASDGGLYIPEAWPKAPLINVQSENDFAKTAAVILEPFFQGDLLSPKLSEICRIAFHFPLVVKELQDRLSVLELFHGPTLAFKDFSSVTTPASFHFFFNYYFFCFIFYYFAVVV